MRGECTLYAIKIVASDFFAVAAAKRHLSVSVTAFSCLACIHFLRQDTDADADTDGDADGDAAVLLSTSSHCCRLGSPFTFHSQVTCAIIKKQERTRAEEEDRAKKNCKAH